MILPDEYRVVLMPFTGDIYACVRIDNNGFPTIYINEALSPAAKRRALDHELGHLERGDFYNHLTIYDAENDSLLTRPLHYCMRAERELTDEEQVSMMLVGYALMKHLDEFKTLPLGQRLARYRREKHLSFSELARISGRTEEELRSYESGTRPDRETLRVLSGLYGDDLENPQQS